MESKIIKGLNLSEDNMINISFYKEPITISEMQPICESDKQKVELISMETGIPITYISNNALNYIRNWIKIDNKWFFIKKPNSYLKFFNELLGQEISNYFGLESVCYKIAKKFEDYCFDTCLMSENFFDNNYRYLTFDDLKIDTSNKKLSKRLDLIKQLCQKNNDKEYLLLQDIIKMSIRDLYSNMEDRHYRNFFLKKDDKEIRLAPLFDYELSFMMPPTIYRNPLLKLDIHDNNTSNLIKNDDMFQEYINKLMDINIEKLLEITQEKNGISISDGLREIFINHDRNAKNIVKTFYLRK